MVKKKLLLLNYREVQPVHIRKVCSKKTQNASLLYLCNGFFRVWKIRSDNWSGNIMNQNRNYPFYFNRYKIFFADSWLFPSFFPLAVCACPYFWRSTLDASFIVARDTAVLLLPPQGVLQRTALKESPYLSSMPWFSVRSHHSIESCVKSRIGLFLKFPITYFIEYR